MSLDKQTVDEVTRRVCINIGRNDLLTEAERKLSEVDWRIDLAIVVSCFVVLVLTVVTG